MDLHDALRPLNVLNNWVGFSPYNFNKCMQKSIKASLYMNNIALAVLLLINVIVVYYGILSIKGIDGGVAVVFVLFVTSFNSTGTVIFAWQYRQRFIACIETLVKLGNDINYLTQTIKCYKSMKRKLIFIIMVCYILIVVMMALNIKAATHYRNFFWQYFMTAFYYTSITFVANSILWIHILLQELNQRFKQVNNFISSLTIDGQARYTKMRLIKRIYRQIQVVSMEINYMFSNHILGQICTSFIGSVYLLYKLTKHNFFVSNYFKYSDVSFAMMVCLQLVSISFIVHYFDSLSNESKKTARLMEEIEKAAGPKHFSYKQVELFSLQVYVDSFRFLVYSYFPLDWTLFHWMASGICTYLVIFHQFKSMERKRRVHD